MHEELPRKLAALLEEEDSMLFSTEMLDRAAGDVFFPGPGGLAAFLARYYGERSVEAVPSE